MLRCPMYDLKCTCPTTKSRIDELTQWSFCIRQFIHSFDHPVRANFGGLRHHLLDGAATPPSQGGEYVLVQHSSHTPVSIVCAQNRSFQLDRRTDADTVCLNVAMKSRAWGESARLLSWTIP